MFKVPVGGERLGSGKKTEAEIEGHGYSSFDLGRKFRTTMSPGTLVPFMVKVALPGDKIDINLIADAITNPTIGPLFGSYKVQYDIFECPMRLYQADMQVQSTDMGLRMHDVHFPEVEMTANPLDYNGDIDNQHINPSSIFKYLGISGLGQPLQEGQPFMTRQFNATSWLAYLDIYKHYYANKQEKIGVIIHDDLTATTANADLAILTTGYAQWNILDGTEYQRVVINTSSTIEIDTTDMVAEFSPDLIEFDTILGMKTGAEMFGSWEFDIPNQKIRGWDAQPWTNAEIKSTTIRQDTRRNSQEPKLKTFPLRNLDEIRMEIMRNVGTNSAYKITGQSIEPLNMPLYWAYRNTGGTGGRVHSKNSPQEGLLVKAYQTDMFNNWIDSDFIETINNSTAVQVEDNQFTMPQLALSKKMYELENKIAVSGGTFDDWMDVVYTPNRNKQNIQPIYHGGLIKELVFQEVINQAGTEEQPLGSLAGRGKFNGKHKGGKVFIKVNEPAYIIGIVSITPRVDYSQGNEWDVNLKTLDDLHKPDLDQIGYQDTITEQMAWWDTRCDDDGSEVQMRSAGKQPAWTNYQTDVDKTYGNFAIKNSEMWMTLNRQYEMNFTTKQIGDLTSYIDPKKYNNIFAYTSRDAMNFKMQIMYDFEVRRLMSAKVQPKV